MLKTVKAISKALSVHDYEEQKILARAAELIGSIDRLFLIKTPEAQAKVAEEAAQLNLLISELGYDPRVARQAKIRGRPRQASLPDPLPAIGTELQSCLGDTYIIKSYGSDATASSINMVAYSFNGSLIFRSIANLFINTLPSGKPVVTWAEDPRLTDAKTGEPIKTGKAKRNLKNDDPRYMDPDTMPFTPEERRKRY